LSTDDYEPFWLVRAVGRTSMDDSDKQRTREKRAMVVQSRQAPRTDR
jgi:hypothetical protein